MVLNAREHIRAPLNNRGPSRDQPAPGSRRHIPAGSAEPDGHVTIVAVLEQNPAYERWERAEDGMWLHTGYRGRMTSGILAERPLVAWDRVGTCAHGTRHDLKDVSDRDSEWQDRPVDLLPERPNSVDLVVTGDELALAALRRACDDMAASDGPAGRRRLRFRRYAPTLTTAVVSVIRDVELAGFDVHAINTGRPTVD